MLSKKLFPFVAGAAMLAAPVVALAGNNGGHRDGNLKPAEAEGIGKQLSITDYSGTLRASDGDRSNLKHAWFEYKFQDGTNLGYSSPGTSGESCTLASFTLDIHRNADSSGQGGDLHLAGSGLDCSAGGMGNGHSIQNFVYYVAQDGDGCYSSWKQGRGTGNFTADVVYSGNDPKTVIHLDGNLLLSETTD